MLGKPGHDGFFSTLLPQGLPLVARLQLSSSTSPFFPLPVASSSAFCLPRTCLLLGAVARKAAPAQSEVLGAILLSAREMRPLIFRSTRIYWTPTRCQVLGIALVAKTYPPRAIFIEALLLSWHLKYIGFSR